MQPHQRATADSVPAVTLSRTYDAPVERVFTAWTKPEHIKRWLHPTPEWTNPSVDVDLRVGGRYRIEFLHPESGKSATVGGEFREVVPNRRLVYTWTWEPPNPDGGVETLVTVTLVAVESGTQVNLRQERFADDAMRQRHHEGHSGALECLQTLLADLSDNQRA